MTSFNKLYVALYVLKKLKILRRVSPGISLMYSVISDESKPIYAMSIERELTRILKNESGS